MAKPRRYKLLCPIARAMDRVGDRWTLLILRDLHAGPARFSDLQAGLDGIASNLLTERLGQLADDGLVERRQGAFGVALYALTDLGAQTGDLLFELARFGGRLPPDDDVRPPGNLRTIAVTLKMACRRVVGADTDLQAEIIVDSERFTLAAKGGLVDVRLAGIDDPDVTLTTTYEPMVAVGDGRLTMDEYAANHATIVPHRTGKDAELADLLGRAIRVIARED